MEHWGVLGEWANLTCAVNAEPPARFEWAHRNRTIVPNDENFILSPQENTSILQVLVRSEQRFGQVGELLIHFTELHFYIILSRVEFS